MRPRNVSPGDDVRAVDWNDVVQNQRGIMAASGTRGINLKIDQYGFSLSDAKQGVNIFEPSQVASAKNIGAVKLNAWDSAQITLPVQLQTPIVDDGQPITELEEAQVERVLEVLDLVVVIRIHGVFLT